MIAARTVIATEGREDTLQWILSDHLFSAGVTAKADGTWKSTIQYTSFGEIREKSRVTAEKYLNRGQLAQDVLELDYYVARLEYEPDLINSFHQIPKNIQMKKNRSIYRPENNLA